MRRRMRLYLCKIFQRRVYDLFSNKQSILLCFSLLCMLIIAFLHIGEVLLIWSRKSAASGYNLFSDNIVDQSFQNQLCQYIPIDCVYTWVNGSDENLMKNLKIIKSEIEYSLTSKSCEREKICDHCIEVPLIFIKPILLDPKKFLKNVTIVENYNDFQLIYFSSLSAAQQQKKCHLSYNNDTYALSGAYIKIEDHINEFGTIVKAESSQTTTKMTISSLILLSNIPENITKAQLLRYLSPFERTHISIINIYGENHIALLSVRSSKAYTEKIVKAMSMRFGKNPIINGSAITVHHPIDLIIGNKHFSTQNDDNDDLNSNRFADNEELRYSLRSLEKYAPWIRNIYIVTNGQIPYWLNLGNPRVKIITHDEIFAYKNHLPTFSSPAIETHIHRIPNLSKKFLYLNDDILFGKEVWPEDFYTQSRGYKVYLSWPVPNCAEGCPMNWLKDGYCDKACNNSGCLWDAGDCDGVSEPNAGFFGQQNVRFRNGYAYGDRSAAIREMNARIEKQYCSSNCANNWLNDKFCDNVCNNEACAFDMGDCGVNNYNKLIGHDFDAQNQFYVFPSGVRGMYFNLSNFVSDSNLSISDVNCEHDSAIRAAKYNFQHNVFTLLLYPEEELRNLTMFIKGIKNNTDFVIRFNAMVKSMKDLVRVNQTVLGNDTSESLQHYGDRKKYESPHIDMGIVSSNGSVKNTIIEEHEREHEHEHEHLYTNVTLSDENTFQSNYSIPCDFDTNQLPLELKNRLKQLEENMKNATESTMYDGEKMIRVFLSQLCDYKTTVKAYDRSMSPFKWEQQNALSHTENTVSSIEAHDQYHWDRNGIITRRLMDSYADSLRHVNQLYNEVFGLEMRKVPPHMAHFVDIDIMSRLQQTFPHHFEVTSSHKIRSSDDMQFAFSYNYFLMSEQRNVNFSQIFDTYDIDKSGSWTHMEIRNVILTLNELPLKRESISEFYLSLRNCCITFEDVCANQMEHLNLSLYYERPNNSDHSIDLSKSLILSCDDISDKLSKHYGTMKVNKYEVMGEDDVSFKMIRSDASIVRQELDKMNKLPKKFMCLNDNIDHKSRDEANLIREMLKQFYESMFPKRSQFELSPNKTNSFANVREYRQWTEEQHLNQLKVRFYYIIFIILIPMFLLILKKFLFYLIRMLIQNRKKRLTLSERKYWA